MKNYKFYFLIFTFSCAPFLIFGQDMNLLISAQSKKATGQYQAAILEYSQIIANAPGYAIAYAERGYCYENLKQYEAALKDLEQAIRLGFADPLAYLNRGWTKYNLGRKNEACLDWRMAEQLGYQAAQSTIDEYCQ